MTEEKLPFSLSSGVEQEKKLQEGNLTAISGTKCQKHFSLN